MIQKESGKIGRIRKDIAPRPYGDEREGCCRMIGLMGKDVAVVACTDPIMVGLRGTVALESMHMIRITTGAAAERTVSVQKKGTVLVLQESGKVVVADEMNGRIEDRLARGYRL